MAPRFQPEALDLAFAVARQQVEAGRVPFAILGIGGTDGVVRVEAIESPAAPRVGVRAMCLLASITKPITASLVMRLAQTGRFPLAAPLDRWLPELDAAGLQPFTAWHVLSHTTGIADFPLEELLLTGGGREELIRRAIAQGQGWPPGSRFLYASHTFDLLALALERALDRPFDALLREEILDPLGMSDTTFDIGACGDRRAPLQLGNPDGSGSPLPPGVSADQAAAGYAALRLAGGGLFSTASDVLRFGRAMLRGGELDGVRVLGRPIVDLMTREVTVDGLGRTDDPLTTEHYALGWGKPGPASPASPRSFGHGGISGTRLWIDPVHDLVVVCLTGRWGGAREVIDEVMLATYGALA